MRGIMEKDKQWAVKISSIISFSGYLKYREAVEKEIFRLAGSQDPKFLSGMKYLLELSTTEYIKLKNGDYDG